MKGVPQSGLQPGDRRGRGEEEEGGTLSSLGYYLPLTLLPAMDLTGYPSPPHPLPFTPPPPAERTWNQRPGKNLGLGYPHPPPLWTRKQRENITFSRTTYTGSKYPLRALLVVLCQNSCPNAFKSFSFAGTSLGHANR